MISKPDKSRLRLKCHKHIRGEISDTAEHPCSSVFRSNKDIYTQLINDVEGVMLAGASASGKNISAEGSKAEQATEVGKALAETAAKKNIKSVVFDRSGHLYHGRIQALADAARENGLEL